MNPCRWGAVSCPESPDPKRSVGEFGEGPAGPRAAGLLGSVPAGRCRAPGGAGGGAVIQVSLGSRSDAASPPPTEGGGSTPKAPGWGPALPVTVPGLNMRNTRGLAPLPDLVRCRRCPDPTGSPSALVPAQLHPKRLWGTACDAKVAAFRFLAVGGGAK